MVAASLAVVRGGSGRTTSEPAGPAAVPPYYVALTAPAYPDVYDGNAPAAEVRATATGAVLAKIIPPKPYVHFAGVAAAADDRTFVLVAEEKSHPPAQQPSPARVLTRTTSRRVSTSCASTRARAACHCGPSRPRSSRPMRRCTTWPCRRTAPSWPPTSAFITPAPLFVFNLATGTERTWSHKNCAHCYPSSGGLGYGGTNVDALSWTGDGKHVAFVGPTAPGGRHTVRSGCST